MTKPTINLLALASSADVCEILGVSRQRAHQLRRGDKTFPRPVYDNGPIVMWRWNDIKHWGMDNGYIERH